MSLPAQWTITAGSQTYTVSSDWLSADLAKAETAPHHDGVALKQLEDDIAVRLDAARRMERASWPQRLDDSRSKLDRILAAKEFETVHGPSWFEIQRARIYDWIRRQLDKLLSHVGHGRVIGNVIAWTVVGIAALFLLVAAIRAAASGSQPGMDLRGASASGHNSSYWLRRARDAAAGGDYRNAIHAAYWAAIARMEEVNLLSENRSRTPRESLRLMRREGAEYAPLSRLTRRFELVWYGYRSADLADWNDAVQQLETLGCLRSSTPAISAS